MRHIRLESYMRTTTQVEPVSRSADASAFDEMPSPTGGKNLGVIDLLAKHPDGLTSSEAVRLSGITANLVFRILKTLVAMDFAVQ